MQCQNCNALLPQGTSICPRCGTALAYSSSPHADATIPAISPWDAQMPQQQLKVSPPPPYQAPPQVANWGAASYGAPQEAGWGGASPYGMPPFVTPPMAQKRKKSGLGLLLAIIGGIVLVAILGVTLLLLPAVFAANHPKQTQTTPPSTPSPTTTTVQPTAAPTMPQAPNNTTSASGNTVDANAAGIITNIQTASNADPTTGEPLDNTTTFKPFDPVYVTFKLNDNAFDFNNQTGYIEGQFYAGKNLVAKKILTVSTPAPGGYFQGSYDTPTTGTAELYWCLNADCGDAKLAQVTTFTIAGA